MAGVTLVVAEWCPVCPSAKRLWAELREHYAFEYEEVDIASERGQALMTKHGIRSVPTTLLDGEVAFVGLPKREPAIAP